MTEKVPPEYHPPSDQAVQSYAKRVCQALTDQRGDPALTHPNIVDGLARYFSLIARLTANQLNQSGSEQK
jgi:hypothetical protein